MGLGVNQELRGFIGDTVESFVLVRPVDGRLERQIEKVLGVESRDAACRASITAVSTLKQPYEKMANRGRMARERSDGKMF